MATYEPNIDDNGVPWCSEDCQCHDGKRCTLLGMRPDSICEPAVIALADAKGRLLEACEWLLCPTEPIGSDAELIRKFTERAKAAIAKAKGGAA